jgi:hypothetical protein
VAAHVAAAEAGGGVCARVVVQITQKLVVTRQASAAGRDPRRQLGKRARSELRKRVRGGAGWGGFWKASRVRVSLLDAILYPP